MKGLFGRFRRAEDDKNELEAEVTLDSLEDWLDQRRQDAFRRILPQVRSLADSAGRIFQSIRSKARGFLETEVAADPSERRKSSKQRSMATLGRRLLEISTPLESIEVRSFDEVEKLRSDLTDTLGELVELGSAYAKSLLTQFPEQIKEMNSEVRELSKIAASLRRIEEENQDTFNRFRKVVEITRKLVEMRHQLTGLSNRKENLESEARSIEGERRRIEDELKKAESSNEYEEYMGRVNDLRILDQEFARAKSEFEQQFSSLLKPLKKMVHIASMDDKDRKIVEACIDDGWGTLITFEHAQISKVLTQLMGLIDSDRLEVKREGKVLVKIESMLKEMPEISRRARELQSKVEEKRVALASATIAGVEELREMLSSKEERGRSVRTSIEETEDGVRKLKGRVEGQTLEVEGRLRDLGVGHVKITV